jgi:7 transmembrane receptor (rhodopsin family)
MSYNSVSAATDTWQSEKNTVSCSDSSSFGNYNNGSASAAANITAFNVAAYIKTIIRGPVLFIGFVGFVANAVVLFALIPRKKPHSGTVNIFIMNQSVIDMLLCLVLIVRLVLGYVGNIKFDHLTCIIIGGGISGMLLINASIMSLVVITLERYVKIVHSIHHRKYYRRWMTYVGVALCWVNGLSTCALSDFVIGSNCLSIPLPIGRVCATLFILL